MLKKLSWYSIAFQKNRSNLDIYIVVWEDNMFVGVSGVQSFRSLEGFDHAYFANNIILLCEIFIGYSAPVAYSGGIGPWSL